MCMLLDKQLKLIIRITLLLFFQVLPNVYSLNSSCAFLKRITVATQYSDVEILIVKLNHACLSLSWMNAFLIDWRAQFVLARIARFSLLRTMLHVRFGVPGSRPLLLHRDDRLQFSMCIVITCNGHFVLLI